MHLRHRSPPISIAYLREEIHVVFRARSRKVEPRQLAVAAKVAVAAMVSRL